jgi:beta-lactamase superfamily II metal-dependent hydrolase
MRPTKRSAAAKEAIRIRMYHVGFGDAFLLFLPTADGTRRVLIDCGSIAGGGVDLDLVTSLIAADLRDSAKSALDVVVATHRHRDHIGGFGKPLWDNIQVREVWLPWTEDPSDPQAVEIRAQQLRLAAITNLRITRLANDVERPLLSFARQMSLNAAVDERATETLRCGFSQTNGAAGRKYLSASAPPHIVQTVATDALPGVHVSVLGPSRSERVIREMEPPGSARYMDAVSDVAEAPSPFGTDYWDSTPAASRRLSTADEDAIASGVDVVDIRMAAALDRAINGTSLVLHFQVGTVGLLFTGDAQWGTWREILDDPSAKSIITSSQFIKVSHHGSSNATPRGLAESMSALEVAAVSTLPLHHWSNLPSEDVLRAFRGRGASVVRSDRYTRQRGHARVHRSKFFTDIEFAST